MYIYIYIHIRSIPYSTHDFPETRPAQQELRASVQIETEEPRSGVKRSSAPAKAWAKYGDS